MEHSGFSHFYGFDGDSGWGSCLAQFQERTEANSELFKVRTANSVTDVIVLGV
jgi:hypothetical protein